MRWAGHLVGMDAGKLANRARVKKTSRAQEKGKATAEMGGLREEGYEKIGEDERWRKGAADKKTMERKKRKSSSTILCLTLTPVQQGKRRRAHIKTIQIN